ncbi:hypothetical protein D3C85_1639840 [compost metagenome]
MRTLLPGTVEGEHQRQEQADQMKHHRRIFANTTIVTVEVGLGIEQKIGDVHREHQEQLALTTINGAIGTTEQQDQGG